MGVIYPCLSMANLPRPGPIFLCCISFFFFFPDGLFVSPSFLGEATGGCQFSSFSHIFVQCHLHFMHDTAPGLAVCYVQPPAISAIYPLPSIEGSFQGGLVDCTTDRLLLIISFAFSLFILLFFVSCYLHFIFLVNSSAVAPLLTPRQPAVIVFQHLSTAVQRLARHPHHRHSALGIVQQCAT